MMADYKLLDPNRKAVLRLPHLAFKLWMTYWMFESDDQEAYVSNATLEEATGMTENTIIKWRKWLVKHGWLRPCGGTAAERYSKATRGAHQVLIYRVDDPTKNTDTSNCEGDMESPTSKDAVANSATANVIPPKFADKVYVSVSSSGCSSGSTLFMTTLPAFGGTDDKPDKVFDLKDEKQKQGQQKQKPRSARLAQKYDAPFPVGFNDDSSEAGVKFRAEWCETHRLDKTKEPAPASVNQAPFEEQSEEPAPSVRMSASPTPPPSSTPPPPEPEPEPEPEAESEPEAEVIYNPTPARCRCDWCGMNVPADSISTHECEGWGTTRKSKPSLRCRTCGELREDCLC